MNIYKLAKYHLDDATEEDYRTLCIENVRFIEKVYEIAFGDGAVHRDFPMEEVLEKISEFEKQAFKFEQIEQIIEEDL